MKAGNDTVVVFAGDFTAPDDVRVDMGYGRDTFVMVGDPEDPALVNDSLSIRTRGKESVIGLANVEVRNNLKIKTGNSQDVIGVSGIEVGGRTNIATRRGADGVVAIDSVFGDTTRVSLGRGNDILGAINTEVDGTLNVNGSDGIDRALVDADSDADDIERNSIAVIDSVNDLPDDVLEEVEDRLEDLADDAEDLLPSRISDIFVDEIESILDRLEATSDRPVPPTGEFFSNGLTISEAAFPSGDFTGFGDTPKTFIGTARNGFNGTITVSGSGGLSSVEEDIVSFSIEGPTTLSFPQLLHTGVVVSGPDGQQLDTRRADDDRLTVELTEAGEYELGLGVPLNQGSYERVFTFGTSDTPPTGEFFSDGLRILESTFPNGDFTGFGENPKTFIGTARDDFDGTITVVGSGGLSSVETDVVSFEIEGPMILSFPQFLHTGVVVSGPDGQQLTTDRADNDRLTVELTVAGVYELGLGVPLSQGGYERVFTFTPLF
jgi:hypothetical protein